MSTRRALGTVVAAALMALGSLITAPSAAAVTPSGAACAANPNTGNCDGVDPTSSGGICQQGAYVVFSAQPVYDGGSQPGTTVPVTNELWWSPVCQTNWARAVSANWDGSYLVDLWRDASSYQGRSQPSGHIWYSGWLNQYSTMWTSMLWSPGPSRACGGDQQTMVGGCTPDSSW